MTFPGLEITILKFQDFSRFSMTVRTLVGPLMYGSVKHFSLMYSLRPQMSVFSCKAPSIRAWPPLWSKGSGPRSTCRSLSGSSSCSSDCWWQTGSWPCRSTAASLTWVAEQGAHPFGHFLPGKEMKNKKEARTRIKNWRQIILRFSWSAWTRTTPRDSCYFTQVFKCTFRNQNIFNLADYIWLYSTPGGDFLPQQQNIFYKYKIQ